MMLASNASYIASIEVENTISYIQYNYTLRFNKIFIILNLVYFPNVIKISVLETKLKLHSYAS